MAMVFRSEKNLEVSKIDKICFENETKNKELIIKDAFNYNNSNILKDSPNKKCVPFGSLSERNLFFDKSNNNSLKNILKQIHENYILNYNKEIDNSNKSYKLKDNTNLLKIFISKEKRFKDFNLKNNIPGPGEYFKENKNKKQKKKIISRNYTSLHEGFFSNRALSNPLKHLDDDNNIKTIHNFIDKQTKTEKFVQTNINNIYYNKAFDNTKKKKLNKKNIFIMKNNDSQFDSNYFNSNRSTTQTVNSSLTIFNYNNNRNSKKELDKYFYTDQSNKIFEISKGKIYINNLITNNNNIYKNYLKGKNSIKNKNILGPGQYFSFHQFNTNSKNINFQNFGSSSVRNLFPNKENNNIYNNFFDKFRENNINIIKTSNELSKMAKSKSSKNINNNNKNKKLKLKKLSKNNIFYKSKEDLLKDNYIFENNTLIKNMGPGKYEPKQKVNINNKRRENFGSSEIRKPITLSKMVTPGPGKYFTLEDLGNNNKVNSLSHIPINIIKDNLKGISSIKYNIFKDMIKKGKNKSPSIGEYFPEKYNSIEYDNQKIINKYLKNKINFVNNQKKAKNNLNYIQKENTTNNNNDENNLDYRKINIKEQKIPFLTNEERKDIENMEMKDFNYIVGPGSYLFDSYFNWNKKSYNLLYN